MKSAPIEPEKSIWIRSTMRATVIVYTFSDVGLPVRLAAPMRT